MKIKCFLWTSQVINVTIVDIACVVALLFHVNMSRCASVPTKCLITRFAECLLTRFSTHREIYLFLKVHSSMSYYHFSWCSSMLKCGIPEKWKMMRYLPFGYKFHTPASHVSSFSRYFFVMYFIWCFIEVFVMRNSQDLTN